ncbi:hypothetical protein Tco_0984062 [Tanacetum coccineum]
MISWHMQMKELVDQAWEKHSHDPFRAPTAHDMEILIETCFMPLALKIQNDSFKFVHELKQEMHADLKYVESLKKEIDQLESDKVEFSIYAHTELQCLYLHKVKKYECLKQKLSKQTKTVSKEVYNELSRSFVKLEKNLISLELVLQQCQEQMKNDTVYKEKASNVFLKEREQYFEIQDLKAQLKDKNIAISKLKKLIEKCKGKSVETKFDKPSVVRQPNALRIPKPPVLGKPTPFSDSLERKSFSKTKDGENLDKMKEKGEFRAFWWDTPLSQRDIVLYTTRDKEITIGQKLSIPVNSLLLKSHPRECKQDDICTQILKCAMFALTLGRTYQFVDDKYGNSVANLLQERNKTIVVMEKQKDEVPNCNSHSTTCSKGLCLGRGYDFRRSFASSCSLGGMGRVYVALQRIRDPVHPGQRFTV